MKNENPILKEKEIARDYYLKRMLIWQQICGFFPSIVLVVLLLLISGAIGEWLDWKSLNDKNQKELDSRFFILWLVLLGVTFLPFFIISAYYSRRYWKSYKECQELVNVDLLAETATESKVEREREREIILPVGNQWENPLIY